MGNIQKAASLEGGRTWQFIKTDAIKVLLKADSRHEPMQRSTNHSTGKRLDERISELGDHHLLWKTLCQATIRKMHMLIVSIRT